jgi:sugar/nucleoside kinase (ribokinase family)
MKNTIDVLGIGNAIMDVIAPVPDSFLSKENIQKGGMTLIDEPRAIALHQALSKSSGDVHEVAGGSAANTMVGIAQLGVRAAYFGKVAPDALGKRFSKGMKAAGVDFVTRPAKNSAATARCLIAVTNDGERSMSTFLGASTAFQKADMNAAMIRSAKVIYLEGYLFDAPPAKAAFVRAAEIARQSGTQVALTLSDSFCVDRYRSDFRALVDNHVDILFANEAEILSLYETDRIDTALDALAGAKKVACITRSEKGSVIQDATRRYHVPAVPLSKMGVGKPVDTTGAGDQYAAGVLAGRAMGLGWQDAGHLGSLCAAEVISHYGARPETPIHELALK